MVWNSFEYGWGPSLIFDSKGRSTGELKPLGVPYWIFSYSSSIQSNTHFSNWYQSRIKNQFFILLIKNSIFIVYIV